MTVENAKRNDIYHQQEGHALYLVTSSLLSVALACIPPAQRKEKMCRLYQNNLTLKYVIGIVTDQIACNIFKGLCFSSHEV